MNVFGIILAAGEGKRAGGNKLSKCIKGKPMLQWVVEKAVHSNLQGSIMVTGKQKEFGERLAALYGIDTVHNPEYTSGMSSSLIKGVQHLPANADGFAIILGDMPFIKVETINMLIEEFLKWPRIIVPVFRKRRGHPPVFSMEYKNAIISIKGDMGAREVLKKHCTAVKFVDVEDRGVVQDIDYLTPKMGRKGLDEYF